MDSSIEPVFFAGPAAFRDWLQELAQTAPELWVGFYKIGTGLPSLIWPEAVDQALCYGWIDGIRKGIDELSYKIRFTPRKPGSIWSAVNINRMEELTRLGLVVPSGLQAFKLRQEKRSAIYSYEQPEMAQLDEAEEKEFREHSEAWDFLQKQPPGYRKTKYWWVISAKRTETRRKRLDDLIKACSESRRI